MSWVNGEWECGGCEGSSGSKGPGGEEVNVAVVGFVRDFNGGVNVGEDCLEGSGGEGFNLSVDV